MPISRGVTDDGPNALPRSHFPGVYEHVLRAVCTEAASDPMFYLTEEADDPLARLEFEAAEAEAIESLIEQRRGDTLYCQQFHLPPGAGAPFSQIPCRCVKSFDVDVTDLITYRPPPERP